MKILQRQAEGHSLIQPTLMKRLTVKQKWLNQADLVGIERMFRKSNLLPELMTREQIWYPMDQSMKMPGDPRIELQIVSSTEANR